MLAEYESFDRTLATHMAPQCQVLMPRSFMLNDYKQLHTAVLWHNHRAIQQQLRRCTTHALDSRGVASRQCPPPRQPVLPPAWLSTSRLHPASLVRETDALGFTFRHNVGPNQRLGGHVTHPVELPYDGFIFACFGNYQKLDPETFGMWMRVLSRVPGSVLWMLVHHGHEVRTSALVALR